MPLNSFEGNRKDAYTDDYYNVISILNFSDKLVENLKKIIRDLKEIITYICDNHMTYATNCGEGYLPYDLRVEDPEAIMVKFNFDSSAGGDYQEKCGAVFNKVVPLTIKIHPELYISAEYQTLNDIAKNSLLSDTIINVWIVKNEESDGLKTS
jgi:hypothetical protein